MNASAVRQGATVTRCVSTMRDPMHVAVAKVSWRMDRIVQVNETLRKMSVINLPQTLYPSEKQCCVNESEE